MRPKKRRTEYKNGRYQGNYRPFRAGAGCVCAPDRGAASQSAGAGKGRFYCGKPEGHYPGAGRGLCAGLVLDGAAAHYGDAAELLARWPDTPVYTAERAVLSSLTGYELTRGVLCAMRRPRLPEAETLLSEARRVAVLENIVDSTNIGAIFRSAAALGIDAILLTPSCCDPLCRRAVRVSMGTVFQVPWTYLGGAAAQWPEKGLQRLRAQGFRSAAMALTDRSVSIDDENVMREPRLAIVLGTEGDGLLPQTIAQCDYTVRIPMSHGVDSLNVAAASAVAFWQLRAR